MLDHIRLADLGAGDVFELYVPDGTTPVAPDVDEAFGARNRHILHQQVTDRRHAHLVRREVLPLVEDVRLHAHHRPLHVLRRAVLHPDVLDKAAATLVNPKFQG